MTTTMAGVRVLAGHQAARSVGGSAPATKEAAEAPAAEVTVVENELADGTKVVVKGEDVFVVGADGAETPAPDGTHTFKDGTTVTTKDGKLVK